MLITWERNINRPAFHKDDPCRGVGWQATGTEGILCHVLIKPQNIPPCHTTTFMKLQSNAYTRLLMAKHHKYILLKSKSWSTFITCMVVFYFVISSKIGVHCCCMGNLISCWRNQSVGLTLGFLIRGFLIIYLLRWNGIDAAWPKDRIPMIRWQHYGQSLLPCP